MTFEDAVQVLEAARRVESDGRPGLEHALVLVESVAGRQRPEEPRQEVIDAAACQQGFTDAGHLVPGEPEGVEGVRSTADAEGSGVDDPGTDRSG